MARAVSVPLSGPFLPNRQYGVPALVLGTGMTTLGVLRSLGRAMIPALCCGCGQSPWFEKRSKWYSPAPGGSVGRSEFHLADYLEDSGLAQGVLVPCSDELVLEIASLGDEFSPRFTSCIPPLSTLETLIDKGTLSEALGREGIPQPRTFTSRGDADLASVFEPGGDSFFVKPRLSHQFFREFGRKAIMPENPDDFHAISGTLDDLGIRFIVQEYVPGPQSNHFFLDGFVEPGGEVVARFARNRLRMHPSDFGSSTLMVSVPVQELGVAVERFDGFLKSLDYRGVFSAEFKKDERDGSFKVIEINTRPWWFVEFAAQCGMDVATMAYRASLGETIDPVDSYQVGQTMICPYYDFFACYSSAPSLLGGIANFMASLKDADHSVFSWEDPLPGISSGLHLLFGFLRRRLGRGK